MADDVTRRGFLGKLAAAMTSAAALALVDPEKLLWEPGKKTFFLPEHVSLKRPSLLETATVNQLPIVTAVLQSEDGRRATWALDNNPIGPYVLDRYVVTVGSQRVTFDLKWKPTNGFNGRVALTEKEKAQIGFDMMTKRTLDLKRFRME